MRWARAEGWNSDEWDALVDRVISEARATRATDIAKALQSKTVSGYIQLVIASATVGAPSAWKDTSRLADDFAMDVARAIVEAIPDR